MDLRYPSQMPDPEATVVVPRHIYDERVIPGSTKKRRFLKYHAGQRITPAQAREAGILPVETPPPPAIETT